MTGRPARLRPVYTEWEGTELHPEEGGRGGPAELLWYVNCEREEEEEVIKTSLLFNTAGINGGNYIQHLAFYLLLHHQWTYSTGKTLFITDFIC